MRDRLKHLAFQRAYHARHREERNAAIRARYAKDSFPFRDYQFRKNYGIGIKERDERIAAQNNICPACGEPFTGIGKQKLAPAIHHDHDVETPHVVAIIHVRCNLIMGQAMDNPELLRKVAEFAARISPDPLDADGPTVEGATCQT